MCAECMLVFAMNFIMSFIFFLKTSFLFSFLNVKSGYSINEADENMHSRLNGSLKHGSP